MDTPAYGLWLLAAINAAVFIIFAFSFTRPRTGRDWRSFGAFSAFLVALFTEMYGFPLTIYLLSGWLGSRYPGLDPFTHNAGHLWGTLLGWDGDSHLNALHLVSNVFIGGGFIIIARAWDVLYTAQRHGELAIAGPYALVRHPQYAGFILILLGFVLQWPTILTLAMFPLLVIMYVRLARQEEREALATFGPAYDRYAAVTPAFFPRLARAVGGGTAPRLGAIGRIEEGRRDDEVPNASWVQCPGAGRRACARLPGRSGEGRRGDADRSGRGGDDRGDLGGAERRARVRGRPRHSRGRPGRLRPDPARGAAD